MTIFTCRSSLRPEASGRAIQKRHAAWVGQCNAAEGAAYNRIENAIIEALAAMGRTNRRFWLYFDGESWLRAHLVYAKLEKYGA